MGAATRAVFLKGWWRDSVNVMVGRELELWARDLASQRVTWARPLLFSVVVYSPVR